MLWMGISSDNAAIGLPNLRWAIPPGSGMVFSQARLLIRPHLRQAAINTFAVAVEICLGRLGDLAPQGSTKPSDNSLRLLINIALAFDFLDPDQGGSLILQFS